MEARLVYGGPGEIHLTAAADLQPGQIILAAGKAAVVSGCAVVKTGDRFAAYTKGVYEVAAASGTTFTQGVDVEWDDTNNLAVANTAGTFDIGRTVVAKTAGQLTTLVNLNETNT